MLIRLLCAALMSLAAVSVGAEEDQCESWRDPTMHALRDELGYVVRVDPAMWAARPAAVVRHVASVADWLGGQAGATVFYVSGHTEVKILSGEWRGEDPLSALKGFLTAGGLDVLVPEAGLWIVGTREDLANAAFVAFAYPLDPEAQGWESAERVGDVERALIRFADRKVFHLPSARSPWTIGVGYYWVPGEAETLIVVTSSSYLEGPGSIPILAYKVKLHRSAGATAVECVWAQAVNGPLMPALAEDLDGDGVRDYYFAGYNTDQRGGSLLGNLISGSDGRNLASVDAPHLWVERRSGRGPKRFAEKGASHDERAVGTNVRVWEFDADSGEFVGTYYAPVAAAPKPGGAKHDLQDSLVADPLDPFLELVGGPENVVEYTDPRVEASGRPGVESVAVRITPVWQRWVWAPTLERFQAGAKSGFPARVLYRYLSQGYLDWHKEFLREREQWRQRSSVP